MPIDTDRAGLRLLVIDPSTDTTTAEIPISREAREVVAAAAEMARAALGAETARRFDQAEMDRARRIAEGRSDDDGVDREEFRRLYGV